MIRLYREYLNMNRLDDVLLKYMDILEQHYPGINIAQLGVVMAILGVLGNTMGHEGIKGTMADYIHPENITDPGVKQCIDFINREILAGKPSRIAIDGWKRGNKTGKRYNDESFHYGAVRVV